MSGLRQSALVVDDHEANRELLTVLLEDRGYTVQAVGDGQAAVDAVGRQPFDVILMDIGMPIMDGLTATRLIREREQAGGLPPTKIVVLTAFGTAADMARSYGAGADAHLSKPLDISDLFQVIG